MRRPWGARERSIIVEITEVRVKMLDGKGERLRAFCSVTIDNAFVIRDLKVIEGAKGTFVAMPSRKLTDRCPRCGGKNHLRAKFCNDCGNRLNENRTTRDQEGRAKLHADIAHPINSSCREMMQSRVLKAYGEELERSKQPDYKPSFEEEEIPDDYEGYGLEDYPPAGEPKKEHGKEKEEEAGFGEGLYP